MFSQAFVGISRRSGVRARQSSVWRSRSSVVGLAFALVVAGTFGPYPLYAQDGGTPPPPDLSLSTSIIEISEGDTGTYAVVPVGPTTGIVTVMVSTGDPNVATVSPSILVFSPPTYSETSVTVRAIDNDIVNPPRSTTITHTATGYPSRTLVVRVTDDEASISEPYVPENLLPAFADTAMIADLVAEVRQPIAPRRLPKATGGDSPLTYSLLGNLPDGLMFHAATRQLRGTPTTETDSAETMIYRVRDANYDADSLLFTITVTPPDLKPSFGDANIPALFAEVNQAVVWPLPSATGGDPPLRYSLSNLPDGLALNPVWQQLQGAATATDTTIAAYTATDVDGDTATLTFAVHIINPDLTPTFGNARVADLVVEVDQAIDPVDLPAAGGGNGPLRYSLSNLPDGWAFHADTRQLRGAATAPDTITATYTATDADGDAATLTFTIVIIAPDLTPAFGDATLGPLTATTCQAIDWTLPAATSGNDPLTYSLSNLPDGLVFHADTRRLQGIPTALSDEGQTITIQGTYTAQDADGDAATLPFTLTVYTGLDAPDWVRAENYLGADSTGTWGGSVLLTWALPSQHAGVDAYRIYREVRITHSTDEHGQLVALDEPRDEFVPWARVDAVPGVSVGRALVRTLDYQATRWAVAAECGGQRTSLTVAQAKAVPRDRAALLPQAFVFAQQGAAPPPKRQAVVQSAMTATEGRVGAIHPSTPAALALGPNYPNPFNPATTIQYWLPQAAEVQLTIHNAVGQVVRTLVAEHQFAGRYAVNYDGRDDHGQPLSSGLYFYRLQAGPVSQVGKMVLLK